MVKGLEFCHKFLTLKMCLKIRIVTICLLGYVKNIKYLMFFVKKLLTSVKIRCILHLTINIKKLFFIVRQLARVLETITITFYYERNKGDELL